MAKYLVQWEIDSEGDHINNPIEAALDAFRHMQREGTTANVFTVTNKDTKEVTTVDLDELNFEYPEESGNYVTNLGDAYFDLKERCWTQGGDEIEPIWWKHEEE